jgi:hypothetical protein
MEDLLGQRDSSQGVGRVARNRLFKAAQRALQVKLYTEFALLPHLLEDCLDPRDGAKPQGFRSSLDRISESQRQN